MTLSLSVVIPTRNREEMLARALGSVAAQDGAEIQVLVVNDGGRDVEASVEPFRAQLRIDVIEHPTSLGPGRARNAAMDIAEGEYISFLDDDDLYLPGHIKNLTGLLASGEADLVYATALVWDRYLDPAEDPLSAPRAFDQPFDAHFLDVMNHIIPSAVAFRSPRSAEARFAADLPVIEDWDLWHRLSRDHGYRFAHAPEPSVIYNRIVGSGSLTYTAASAQKQSLFRDCYHRICARWPARSAQGEEYRLVIDDVYELAFAQLRRNIKLPAFWYEDVVQVLYEGFQAGTGREQLHAPLRAAMGIEPV